jgi:hypothetical protein
MRTVEKLSKILDDFSQETISKESALDKILLAFNIPPRVWCTQDWEEDDTSKTGFSSMGWFIEDGYPFDEIGYELEEVIETDKHGNPIKAWFKYVGTTDNETKLPVLD